MRKLVMLVLLLASLLAFVGCSPNGDTSTSSSVTNPNPNAFTPKGTVSGLLRDAVTNEAIVNAKVSIMDTYGFTNSSGLFTIYNVPALQGTGNEPANAAAAAYPVVIDMANVNAAITTYNATATVKKAFYPSMSYTNVMTYYTSLGETSGAAGITTNHDTPMDGFVANITPFVGKLDANIKIQVVSTSLAPQVGATVYLFYNSAGTPVQSGTGTGTNATPSTGTYDGAAPGKLIATATTDASGYVTFSGIEAKRAYVVQAVMGATQGWWVNPGVVTPFAVPANVAASALTSPSDNLLDTYGLDQTAFVSTSPSLSPGTFFSAPIVVRSVDGLAPFVLSVTPANLSDFAIPVAPATTLDVVFTFSEAIRSTPYANALTRETSVNGGLYMDVAISYLGPKLGNIPYSLAWSTDRTQLTVSIPIASMTAASRYKVDISKAVDGTGTLGAAGRLTDAVGNTFLGAPPANTVISFTTAGGFNVAAPVIVKDNVSPYTVNWTPVTNAFGYKVYVEAAAGTGFFPVKTALATNLLTFTTGADVVVPSPTTYSLTLLDSAAAPVAGNPVVIGQRADGTYYNVMAGGYAGGKSYNVKVVAVSSNNSNSDFSNILAVSETKPAAPAGLARRGIIAANEYIIDWTAVTAATQYNVWIQTLQNGTALAGYVPVAVTSIDPTFNLATVANTPLLGIGTPGFIPAGLPFAGTGVAVNGYPLGAKLSYNVAVSTTSPTNTLTSDLSAPVLIDDKRGVALAGRAALPFVAPANNGNLNIAAASVAPPVALAPAPVAAQAANGSYFGAGAKTSLAFTQAVTIQASEQLNYTSAIDATKYTIAQLTATAFGTTKPALAAYVVADATVTAVADIIPTITGIAYNRALPGAVGPGQITFTLNYAGTGTVAAPGTIAAWYGSAGSLVLQATPVDLNGNALPLFDNGTGNVGGVIIN